MTRKGGTRRGFYDPQKWTCRRWNQRLAAAVRWTVRDHHESFRPRPKPWKKDR